VYVEERGRPGVTFRPSGLPVPEGKDNLAVRAAYAFLSKAGQERGLLIELEKRIPTAAGLGGGSSDAGAVLRAMHRMYPGALSEEELAREAVSLGADVPFFIRPEPSLTQGIGEVLEPLDWWPKVWYVLVRPPIAVSTGSVYARLKIELTTNEYDYIFKVLKQGVFRVADLLENDLERVTESEHPVIGSIKQALKAEGAKGALMTGSGPTVFGVFPGEEEARAAAEGMITRGLGQVFVVTNWLGESGGVWPCRFRAE
jgi:4-diphosphocytidyl-2-C-methyl-D-erythritol kinase